MKKITGPFTQILPLTGLPLKGALKDSQLQIIKNAWVLSNNDRIITIGTLERLRKDHPSAQITEITGDRVLLPGFIDCHTHICFAGSRANDYALRSSGKSYTDIAKAGGGIWDTVTATRAASEATLVELLVKRADRHLSEGVSIIEVKSGYGLSVEQELKQLRAIKEASYKTKATLVPTCLAAHMLPKDFEGTRAEYLDDVLKNLLPIVKKENLATRVDIFVEDGAFKPETAMNFLQKAKEMGFAVTVHADQFTTGGSELAVEVGAVSADHQEATKDRDIKLLAKSDTVAVALPGASLGLGMQYAPARKLLNAGACLAIASDWNPGSAPMGDLLMQAAVLGAAEKLSAAEVFAGLTFRAAQALRLTNRGTLATGTPADFHMYPTNDYRDILYNQGKLKPILR
ncbi:imidazolonepropionase [Mucilaginibacter gotjawali]|uniref:Imidazolonepropionase n=1 Tax=Mucilaginibacter gotjawali TaxID=1550579 RepID=A0A839SBR3_9SPHI|nr:imidazolonepropionase [Mucilaginibacter gotjawali]MBB3055048.1 imidazolonepropionase [Mucilaginibacter gotjawali]